MSLVAAASHALVAPLESLAVDPPFVSRELPDVMLTLPDEPTEPSFLLAARALAANHGDSAVAHARLAQAELANGSSLEAIEAARQAIEFATPDSALPVIAAIQVLLSEGQLEDADAAVQSLPDSNVRAILAARIAILHGQLDVATELLEGLDSVEALTTIGWLHLKHNAFAQAIRAYRKVLDQIGPSSDVLTNMGYAYAALGALDKAIRVTAEARQIDPFSELTLLNLANYHRERGDLSIALDEIRRFRDQYGERLGLAFAEAELRLALHDPEGAEKTLRRVRTSTFWANADLQERAELEANLAFVQWRLGKTNRTATRDEVIAQLERTEFRSLAIASMLGALMRRADDAEALSRVLERLGEANPEERFYRLEALHAVLVMDFERALRLALEWNDGTFRDPSAPSTAIYLLTDITGDFDEAIRIGYAALPRFPANKSLLNNLAYALALASRYAEARRLISRVEDDVHVLATRGLIELLSGQTQAGHSFYDDAARLAEERSDSELVELVRYNEALFASLAHQRSGQGVEAEDLRVEFPHDWKDDASLVLLVALADREGIPYRVA